LKDFDSAEDSKKAGIDAIKIEVVQT